MIKEWFNEYIYQPWQKFYNYVTGSAEQPRPEERTDFSADQHDTTSPPSDNDII